MRYVLQTSVFDLLTLIMTRKVAGATDRKPLVFRLLSTKICIFFARKVAECEQRRGIYITVQIVFVAFWTVQKKAICTDKGENRVQLFPSVQCMKDQPRYETRKQKIEVTSLFYCMHILTKAQCQSQDFSFCSDNNAEHPEHAVCTRLVCELKTTLSAHPHIVYTCLLKLL